MLKFHDTLLELHRTSALTFLSLPLISFLCMVVFLLSSLYDTPGEPQIAEHCHGVKIRPSIPFFLIWLSSFLLLGLPFPTPCLLKVDSFLSFSQFASLLALSYIFFFLFLKKKNFFVLNF